MRKAAGIILALLCILSLVGCNYKNITAHSGTEYIISAIGFDSSYDSVDMVLEAIIINSEDAEADKKTELLKGRGKTVADAYSNILRSATEPILLSHAGVVVIGDSITTNHFKDICHWFYYKKDTTLGTFFVFSEVAEDLLSCETVSSIAVGYDIVGLLEQSMAENKTDYKNRFYQVESRRLEHKNPLSLPYFYVNNSAYILQGNINKPML